MAAPMIALVRGSRYCCSSEWFYNRCELPHFVSSSTSPPWRSKNISPQFRFGKKALSTTETEPQRILSYFFYEFSAFSVALCLCGDQGLMPEVPDGSEDHCQS